MFYFNPYTTVTGGKERSFDENIAILKKQLNTADAVVIGAGSGLSTAAGYVYTGERMKKYFSDFAEKYGIQDMYSGGFYPYSSMEEFWGFWCRYIWINRYAPIPSDLYERLFQLVKDKDYFVLTTNVDHCFQRAGFDKNRLFYTQGDYGLFQSSNPKGKSADKTYDNYDMIRKMILAEGYEITENGELIVPETAGKPGETGVGSGQESRKSGETRENSEQAAKSSEKETGSGIKMVIPSDLVPYCPDDGELMTTNLRVDDSFVEDEGWHRAAERYHEFLRQHEGLHVLYLELGVGMNTPVIIKFPFWNYTEKNKKAFYACINLGEAGCTERIQKRSVCMNAGIGEVVDALLGKDGEE